MNGLTPNRWQTITQTNNDVMHLKSPSGLSQLKTIILQSWCILYLSCAKFNATLTSPCEFIAITIRLFHSPGLVAVGPSMGYEAWLVIG